MLLKTRRLGVAGVLLMILFAVICYHYIYGNTKVKVARAVSAISDQDICLLDEDIKRIALTFDDGPNPDYTEKLLDGLKSRGVKATFFLLGEEAQLYPDIVERINKEGHMIGTHSYEHVDLSILSEEQARAQVSLTNQKLMELTGEYPQFIRFPYGSRRDGISDYFNMVEVQWDIDTMDWSVQNADCEVCCVERQVKDGAIILMHDAYEQSVNAALRIIDILSGENYEFITVDQLIFE